MIKFFKKLIIEWLNRNWLVVEVIPAIWSNSHGRMGLHQSFITYSIEFNPVKERYRITTKGKKAKKHRVYTEALNRLAAYNTGKAFQDEHLDMIELFEDVNEEVKDKVVVVSFPLYNEADVIWEFCSKDPILLKEKEKLKKALLRDGLEIYEERDNILATNKGYVGTFWYKDVSHLPVNNNPLGEDKDNPSTEEDENED